MGWSLGYDTGWDRWIGYGVPATCDFPGCGERIDRGLAYVCGSEPYGGDRGCGLYFCMQHLQLGYDEETETLVGPQLCAQCTARRPPFEPTPDVYDWLDHVLFHSSWREWRNDNQAGAAVLVSRWVHAFVDHVVLEHGFDLASTQAQPDLRPTAGYHRHLHLTRPDEQAHEHDFEEEESE